MLHVSATAAMHDRVTGTWLPAELPNTGKMPVSAAGVLGSALRKTRGRLAATEARVVRIA